MKRPFLYIFIPLASGIAAGYFLSSLIIAAMIASVFFMVLFFLFSSRKIISHFALYIAIFLFGIACYQHSLILSADHIVHLTPGDKPSKVYLRGMIIDDPVIETTPYREEKKIFTIMVSAYKKEGSWKGVRGLVKVDQYFVKPSELKYGDEVTAEGLLYRPSGLKNPGLFDYARYLSLKGIYSILKVEENFSFTVNGRVSVGAVQGIAYEVRGKIRSIIDRYMDYPYAGFVKAIIIGDRSDLPDSITEDFMNTGTVHILAISGLNLGIIAAIILAILGILRIPKRVNLAITLLAIGVYSVTAGASPPVIRAAIVFAVYVIGYLIKRDADMLNSLAIAGVAILLWNPRELFDPSFQLSFGSVACIIVFTPHIEKLLCVDIIGRRSIMEKTAHYLVTGVAVSIAAWAGTWPIVAAYFNITSPVSILANLVIIPALFLLTAASFAFLCVSFFLNALAALLAIITQGIAGATFFTNHLFAIMPYAYFRTGSPKTWFMVLYYALIFALVMPAMVPVRYVRIRKTTVIAMVLLSMNLFAWTDALSDGGGKVRLTFLDVGQGDSALIELPRGGTVLIDGGVGSAEGKFDAGKNVVGPYLWNLGIRRLDAVVVTHFHDDHLGGILYILENFKVGAVIDNGALSPGSAAYNVYLDLIKRRNIRRIKVREGDVFKIGGSEFFVLNPQKDKTISDSNDDSIVMKFTSGDTNILFGGDIQENSMERLRSYGKFLRSDIVKVPHHGSSLGSEDGVRNFFKIISPKMAVISVGKFNRYNAPSKDVSNALTGLNIRSYVTKDIGAVIVSGK